jgi:hypothetical protein
MRLERQRVRHVVGALEKGAKTHEVPALVVCERRIGQPPNTSLVAHALEEGGVPLGDRGQHGLLSRRSELSDSHISPRCARAPVR